MRQSRVIAATQSLNGKRRAAYPLCDTGTDVHFKFVADSPESTTRWVPADLTSNPLCLVVPPWAHLELVARRDWSKIDSALISLLDPLKDDRPPAESRRWAVGLGKEENSGIARSRLLAANDPSNLPSRSLTLPDVKTIFVRRPFGLSQLVKPHRHRNSSRACLESTFWLKCI